jgi:hypothetical protein
MSHHSNHPRHHQSEKKKGLQRDWRMWTVVILMLVAIAAYVLSDNEALGPSGQPQEAMEAVGE